MSRNTCSTKTATFSRHYQDSSLKGSMLSWSFKGPNNTEMWIVLTVNNMSIDVEPSVSKTLNKCSLISNRQNSSQSFLKCHFWIIICKFSLNKVLHFFHRLTSFFDINFCCHTAGNNDKGKERKNWPIYSLISWYKTLSLMWGWVWEIILKVLVLT